jgi:hypothetical protein
VRSIVLHTSVPSQGPKKIILLINKPALGFEDVEDKVEPEVAQVLELSEDTVKQAKHIPLRYVRFQTVNSLHVSTLVLSNEFILTIIRFSSHLTRAEKMSPALMPSTFLESQSSE